MREGRTSGSVRGAPGDRRLYPTNPTPRLPPGRALPAALRERPDRASGGLRSAGNRRRGGSTPRPGRPERCTRRRPVPSPPVWRRIRVPPERCICRSAAKRVPRRRPGGARGDPEHRRPARGPPPAPPAPGKWPRGSGPRRRRPLGAYGEKDTVSGISVMPLYFSIARFMRFSLWPSRLFHSAHQLRKFLKVSSSSERMPK